MTRLRGRRLFALLVSGLLVVLAVGLLRRGPLRFQHEPRDPPQSVQPTLSLDDASHMNRTQVAEILRLPSDPNSSIDALRSALARARREHLGVSIAGARHSMGGQSLAANGIVIDMLALDRMDLDAASRVLHVGAGARWALVIPYLDARGLSVGVMQSNNDFTVGGSLSVNCHGWQHSRAPIASTVRAFRLMKADGSVVRCSRQENGELFSLVLGGYGLFGVMLDVDLVVVANESYTPEAEIFPAELYARRFEETVRGRRDIGMAYGRLCVVPGSQFLREAILNRYRRVAVAPQPVARDGAPENARLRRTVFRRQAGSDTGKELRWRLETEEARRKKRSPVSRNQLLNEPAEIYQERDAAMVDILQEYFVPAGRLGQFLESVREVVPRHEADLLNVTVRDVSVDRDAFLRYADQDMFALVMLFTQQRSPEADQRMAAMTRELVEAALEVGGRYYLPYRLHATRDQFLRAYPRATEFFGLKRRYDPDEVFSNGLYLTYGREDLASIGRSR